MPTPYMPQREKPWETNWQEGGFGGGRWRGGRKQIVGGVECWDRAKLRQVKASSGVLTFLGRLRARPPPIACNSTWSACMSSFKLDFADYS